MRHLARVVCAVVICLSATPASAQQSQPAAGRIKIASGSVFVIRDGRPIPAKVGEAVYEADSLRTGTNGRLGVTLKDDTRVSLGPSSEIRLDRFTYAPAESQFGLALRLVRGVAAYVSGRIAKLAPDAIRLETPAAIVGVRGTTVVLRSDAGFNNIVWTK